MVAKEPSLSAIQAEPPAGPAGDRRLTIAVLVDNANFLEGCYEASLREALDARCRQAGYNLLLLYGGPVGSPGLAGAADNAIFRAVRPDSFDGIVVVSSMLAAFSGPEPVIRLVETYRPACMCSIGLALPGVPSLVIDNRSGMEAIVEHLVREHGVRRPAFLAGTPNNPEAQTRLETYQAVLAKNGISFDPKLVVCGYFMPEPGRRAVDDLLAAGVAFDAVIAANDNMALGAVEALRKWGRRVPRDIPVTGFDDLPIVGAGTPPLTTVAQPLDRMANLAVDTVLAQLAGQTVPDCLVLRSEFIRRRSCGCEFEQEPKTADPPATLSASRVIDRIMALEPRLSAALRSLFERNNAEWVSRRLVEPLRSEVLGRRRAFTKAVGDLLEEVGEGIEGHGMIQEAIGWLRDELHDVADIELERTFYEALSLIASSAATAQTQRSLMLEDSYATWLGVTRQASVALDLSSLKETLIKGLPAAGVRTAFLSCALTPEAVELTPVVGLVDGQPLATPEPGFPISKLVPPKSLALEPRRTFLVFPAAVESQLFGVAAFDYADGGKNYAVFRNEITAVLKSIRLHQELVQKTMLHERSVQERLATTKRMEALSVLAGGVAHDLNNALGPLVALPDLILRDLKNLSAEAGTVAKLTADIEIIKTASLRAAQTIKDLLTLGRQGRTVKEALDLNRVVRSCVAESSLRLVEDKSRQVHVVVDYCGETLTVRGSEAQLARAIGNLLRNAGDAIQAGGRIAVSTRRVQLSTTANRYETIPAGDFAVVTVADDGCGIEPVDMGRVFEPFFTRKPTGESSGSGLGLAIVHGVVKEHEGWIDLSSTPGKGTTFSLYFPLAQAVQKEPQPVSPPRRTPAKILIIDDEAIQRRTCRRVLTELGHQVDTMESGLRAYHLFRRAAAAGTSPYDLLVLDMVLGESLDGLQIFDLIQRMFPEQKAIVASGHAPRGSTGTAAEKGLVWLAKPYTIDALTNAVERILASGD